MTALEILELISKNGSDKRKVTSKQELSRLLQNSGNLYAEEMLLQHSSLEDFNWDKFQSFYEEKYKEPCDKQEILKYLENLRLGAKGKLNVAGALLFGKNVQKLTPSFFITAIWFRGNSITGTEYRSSENIIGTLDQQYKRGYDFILGICWNTGEREVAFSVPYTHTPISSLLTIPKANNLK